MILVTGASGLIGRALAARVLAAGESVRLQGRSAESVAAALYGLSVQTNLEVVPVDFSTADQPDYDRLAAGCTTIVHCAGLVHNSTANAAAFESLNFRATQMLGTAAKKAKVDSFVFLSTSAVYGAGPFVNVREDSEPKPDTPYAVSKLRCEQWLEQNSVAQRTIVLRPSLVFGEGDRGNMVSLIKQINKGLFFHIGGNQGRKSIIYSADVAVAIEACLNNLGAGFHVLNVANPKSVGVVDLCNDIARNLSKAAPPVVPELFVRAGAMLGGAILGEKAPLTVEKMNKLMTTTTCNVDRIVEMTGFAPQASLSCAIAAEIKWARQEGILESLTVKSVTEKP